MQIERPTHVAIVGAGLMGSQIGCEYLLGGHVVTFVVRDEEGARARVDAGLALAAEYGLAAPDEAAQAAERASFVRRSAGLPAATAIVVESIPERFELKQEVLGDVARRLPDAIVASNTSSIPLTTLGRAVGAPERIIGTHYWNPPLLMPPVEIIRGSETAADVVTYVRGLIESLGKEPILVERDVPGFIWNRLQAALLREVLWLVENGVASPRTVDEVVKSGLARRSRYTGPFETIALGGLESWTRVSEALFPLLSTAQEPGDLSRWLDRTPAELAEAAARRDGGLAAELARAHA